MPAKKKTKQKIPDHLPSTTTNNSPDNHSAPALSDSAKSAASAASRAASKLPEYERLRAENIARNKAILAELGLLAPPPIVSSSITPKVEVAKKKRKTDSTKPKVKRAKQVKIGGDGIGGESTEWVDGVRRSSRLSKSNSGETIFIPELEISSDLESEYEDEKPVRVKWTGGNVFGPIKGISVGSHRETRMEWSDLGLHRPTVAGIHGSETEGCYSIALSGGYEDDLDYGEMFTFTGEGGRDLRGTPENRKNLRTAPQSKPQTLTRGNLALVKSFENKTPVRVIRGYKLKSPYAPASGYRYDGLYMVERWWCETGLAGFLVYKYALKRVEGQPPIPVNHDWAEENSPSNVHADVENGADDAEIAMSA